VNPLRVLVRWFGRDLVKVRQGPGAGSGLDVLAARGITLVLDVGANTGQFAKLVRRHGYRGRMACFEPLAVPFAALQERVRGDAQVVTVQAAVGAVPGEGMMHVAGNAEASSLLPALPRMAEVAPEARAVGQEGVRVTTIDEALPAWLQPQDRVFLKVDAQGYEQAVLDGARQSLPRIEAVQLEISLVPLYEGAPSLRDLLDRMQALGFELWGLQPVFSDPRTGQLLQVDAVFARPPGVDRAAAVRRATRPS
jgi:FkbM family methyltransferase